ncbi:hypothetical protein pb186bvf_013994 [Paramecium bursaria]
MNQKLQQSYTHRVSLSQYVKQAKQINNKPNKNNQSLVEIDENQNQNYRLENIIGQGQFAQVRICRHIDRNQRYAVKIYNKSRLDQTLLDNINKEIQLLKIINHRNIIQIRDNFENEKQIYIVMDYISSLSLQDFIKDRVLTEQQIKIIFKQLVSAIQYLHSQFISHRDIKLENILYGQQIVLIDFGFAIQTDRQLTIPCGTPEYMSPELKEKLPYYPMAADIYACGILLQKLLKKCSGDSTSRSQGLKRILGGCLEKNPTKRWNANKLYNELIKLE